MRASSAKSVSQPLPSFAAGARPADCQRDQSLAGAAPSALSPESATP